ncbi:MAG: rhomboid family intramembrane serine protease [Mesorhizobium sp.]
MDSDPQVRREPVFNLPFIVTATVALCVAIHVLRVYVLSDEQNYAVMLDGAFFPVRYSGGFDIDIFAFTSPITSSLLHGGWLHLGFNMVWLLAFGSPLANRLGPLRFVLFWIVCALGALLLHFVANPNDMVPVIGASGAISGMMGAAARYGFRIERATGGAAFGGPRLTLVQTLTNRQVLAFLGVWLAINLAAGAGLDLSGSDGAIAWEAHIGGMVTGLLLVGLFDRRRIAPAFAEPDAQDLP